jgi:hypothetical protein
MYKVCYRISERSSNDEVFVEAFFYERPTNRNQCISVFTNMQNYADIHITVLGVNAVEDE